MKLLPLGFAAAVCLAPLASPAAPSVDFLQPLSLEPQALSGQSLAEFSTAMGFGAQARAPWYALFWKDGELQVQPFKGFRERPGPFDWTRPEADTRIAEPDCEEPPLMAFRVKPRGDGPDAARLATGTIPGINLDDTIRAGWSRAFDLAGKGWMLRADYAKGPGGRSLPGSMRLTIEGAEQPAQAVLERHPGLVFREQSVLWAGDLTLDGRPDFLLRRTLVTGETDYILSASRADGTYAATGVTRDPDNPSRGFSSGIEEGEYETWRHANSPRPYPVYKPPQPKAAKPGSYALSGPMKVKAVAIYANPRPVEASKAGHPRPGLSESVALTPGVKRDLSFTFAGEPYRLLSELVPTWHGKARGPRYDPQLFFGAYGSGGGLTLRVSIQHRGVKQVLLVTQPWMDGGPMTLTAGDLDGSGRLSLSIDWMPHYNNGMNNTWTRADEPERVMKRVSTFQSQGC